MVGYPEEWTQEIIRSGLIAQVAKHLANAGHSMRKSFGVFEEPFLFKRLGPLGSTGSASDSVGGEVRGPRCCVIVCILILQSDGHMQSTNYAQTVRDRRWPQCS